MKGARFQRIVPPKGDEHSETEGQGTMSLVLSTPPAGLGAHESSEAEGQGLVEYALIFSPDRHCMSCRTNGLGDAIVRNLWDGHSRRLDPRFVGV